MRDKDGLAKAYDTEQHTYVQGDTLYVAGTKNLTDVLDWPLLPQHKVKQTHVYKMAKAALLKAPNVKRIVGHSLGASVASDLATDYGKRASLYSEPAMRMHNEPGQESFHHPFDPVAVFDWAAKFRHVPGWNPHDKDLT